MASFSEKYNKSKYDNTGDYTFKTTIEPTTAAGFERKPRRTRKT